MEEFNQKLSLITDYLKNRVYNNSDKENRGLFAPHHIIDSLVDFPNKFYYVGDDVESTIIYVTPNVKQVLGYEPEEIALSMFYQQVHPEDIIALLDLVKTVYTYASKHYLAPLTTFFQVDYRIRHKEGHYIRIQRHNVPLLNDSKGNMLFHLSECVDISHIKMNEPLHYQVSGPNTEHFYFDVAPYYSILKQFKSREVEILKHLYTGKSSLEIADILSISRHTVDTHRRNLLKKSSTKSTTELLAFARENGLV